MSLGRYFTLNTGAKIPAVGFGTFANDGPKGQTYTAAIAALRAGYRHLDCAWFYKNEDEVGQAIRDFLAEDKSVKREDLFIVTKVWNHLHRPEDVEWSCKSSLKNLGLDYLDLYLVHWPIAAEKDEHNEPKIGEDGKYVILNDLTENPEPTWRAMEALQRNGLTKAIGVSNWTIRRLKALLAIAEIPPAANQVELHPFLPQPDLVKFCLDNKILPIAYSPLGSQNQVPTTGERLLQDKTLIALSEKLDKPLANILISWAVQRGYACCPKSSTPSRIAANFEDLELSEEDMKVINGVAEGRNVRFVNMKDTFGYDVWANEEQ
ncbi:Glycerol 2-dehydrogenase (NADP(+)) [Saitoella coloradoensis]